MMASRGAVVFGGAGFIGTHLLARLQKAGVSPLYSVDLRPPDRAVAGVCYLSHDCRDLRGLVLEGPVDLAFDLLPALAQGRDPAGAALAPAGAAQAPDCAAALCAFLRGQGINRLVYLSSLALYGHGGDSLSEQSPPAPCHARAWAEWRNEGIYRCWQSESERGALRRLVICRAGEIFGANAARAVAGAGGIGRMALQMARGGVSYPGRKDLLCPCYYVEDLIDALFYALAQDEADVLFNGCYRERISLGDIGALLKSHAFPAARELVVPWFVVLLIALLRGLIGRGQIGSGQIAQEGFAAQQMPHDILPGWLDARGQAKPLGLEAGLRGWISSDRQLFPQGLQTGRRQAALPRLARAFAGWPASGWPASGSVVSGSDGSGSALRGRLSLRRVFRPNGR